MSVLLLASTLAESRAETAPGPTIPRADGRPRYAKYPFNRARAAFGNHHISCHSQDVALYEMYFNGYTGGFFVEVGASDGLTQSVNFAFEQALNWTGVLLEGNPTLCTTLHHNRPGAQCLCSAISHDWSPVAFQFDASEYAAAFEQNAGIEDAVQVSALQRKKGATMHEILVPSAPLGWLLRVAGVYYVDLLIVSGKGSEWGALSTMDWSIPVRMCVLQGASQPNSAALLMRQGFHRVTWPPHAGGQSELWVLNSSWPPQNLKWRPLVDRVQPEITDAQTHGSTEDAIRKHSRDSSKHAVATIEQEQPKEADWMEAAKAYDVEHRRAGTMQKEASRMAQST